MRKLLLAGVAALSLLCVVEAHAGEPMKWQCGNVRVIVTYKPSDDDRWFSGDTEYTLIGVEKANNRFKWANDGLYLNDKVCWPITPITCLRPDGTTEPCESRQIPLPQPRPAEAPAPVPIPKTVLYYEPGGLLEDHVKRWKALAESGDNVEIRGPCASGCTMILAYVPSNRICFAYGASLMFHKAQTKHDDVTVPNTPTTQWMLDQYSPDIRTWLIRRGGVEEMTVKKFWILDATELWEMGYRKCDPEQPPVPMTKRTSKDQHLIVK
jgi:hypothetical protein